MSFTAEQLLSALLEANPMRTSEAPKDVRGLYGLVDHHGQLRYIGSTKSNDQSFYTRIHHRHRTGSEGKSHYFSRMYNTGRMWRDPSDQVSLADGLIAKKLRREFVLDHCRAVWVPLPDTAHIAQLEKEVIALAPAYAVAWNQAKMGGYDEPVDLVDATMRRLNWVSQELAAIERQRFRYTSLLCRTIAPPPFPAEVTRTGHVPPFPRGPFRFFALDVETANNDRSSICQIGVAGVRADSSIETWVTYVDPQVERWGFTGLHGISAHTVRGAPTFRQALPVLEEALQGALVYQHSCFDRSAVIAAANKHGLLAPQWEWRDSVEVARAAWPELRGKGGHGLASLKQHLGLVFEHHDAGEDARAAAQVVLLAEGPTFSAQAAPKLHDAQMNDAAKPSAAQKTLSLIYPGRAAQCIGTTKIKQANIENPTGLDIGMPAWDNLSSLRQGVRQNVLSEMETSMLTEEWYKMTPQTAQAYGRPTTEGFCVRAGSTAMVNGSPSIKRDKSLQDLLVTEGVLVKSDNPTVYRFARDYLFTSSSAAGGIIKDGNCSGPVAWKRVRDGFSLRDVQSERN